jgi:GDP-L-fucose synthase
MLSSDNSTLILGADGFLGSHLVAYVKELGWPCYPVGRSAGDFSDFSVVASAFRKTPPVSRIFHLITKQRTGPAQLRIQAELLQINARIHLNILEAWRLFQPQAKLISTGSSCAFPERQTPLGEDDFQSGPLHASVSGYGLAKQILAVGSRAYGEQYGLRWLHVFLATLYGPSDHKSLDRSHFMTALLDRAVREQAAGRTTFEIWGAPDTVRDLLYVTDQIEAILAADAAFQNEMLNVTSNAPVTIGTVVEEILRSLNWPADVYYPPGTFQGANFKSLDSQRFLSRTGWKPRYSLASGIHEVLRRDYTIA